MAKWAKRVGCCLLAALALAGAGLVWMRSAIPDTLLVPRGQPVTLAQMPWLQARSPSGASQAGTGAGDRSENTTLSLWGVVPVKTVRTVQTDRRVVSVSGRPFGIKMFAEGALLVGFTDIRTEAGYSNPAKEAGLRLGDWLVSVDGHPTRSNEDVKQAVRGSLGQPVTVVYSRGGVRNTTTLTPVQEADSGEYRAGMWVRDSSAGIGTLTFVDEARGIYGGLGHSISDTDTGERIALRSGEVVPVTITGYVVGAVGSPGELKGKFTSRIALGNILQNGPAGVYGKLRRSVEGTPMPVAFSQEIQPGPATLITTIAGTTPASYAIQIERVSLSEEDPNRNMVLHVTDEALLNTTGGIVQGMSGSPIIQDGRLVGAVTHVLVNDPTRGYGIFIENMLKTADSAA